MLKKVLSLVSIVVVGMMLVASVEAAPKIYFIVKATENSFWQTVIDGGKTAAEKLGVDFVAEAAPSEADVARQIAIVETAVGAKPAAIVLAPTVADALVPAIEKATAAGIPVILIDSAASTDKYVSFLASDNIAIGTIAADEMAKALKAKFGKEEGKVACITYMSGVGSLEARKQGFLDQVKAKYPGITIVDFQDAQGKQGQSLAIAQNFLTTYPDLNGIYANNLPTGEETVRALDMAKKTGLAVVVVDAGEQEQWGLANGFVDAMIVQQPWKMGYMGIEYALKAVNGEKLEKFIDTGVTAISPEMLKSGAAEEYLNPVEFNKKQK